MMEVDNQKTEEKCNSKMELFTRANGLEIKSMDMECKFGLMGLGTKGTGDTIKPVVKGNSGMQMVMSLKESGKMTRQMGMVCMCI